MAGAQDIAQAADQALHLALELTGASVAFIGLFDDAGKRQQVFSRAADPSRSLNGDEIDRLFAAARTSRSPRKTARMPDPGLNSYCGIPLKAGGNVMGMIGVAGGNIYTVVQRQALAILANQVAAAIEILRFAQ